MRGKEECSAGVILMVLLVTVSVAVQLRAQQGDGPQRAKAHGILANYFEGPISFEPNQGQADTQVKFVARGAGYNLFLMTNNAMFSFRDDGEHEGSPRQKPQLLTMTVVGANPTPRITGEDRLPAQSSYFLGADPKSWHTSIPNFGKVQYENIYPGIDLVFHGLKGQLEYDFLVHPGATPEVIAVAFKGSNRLELNSHGELVLQAGAGRVFFHKPIAYQQEGKIRQIVPAHYRMTGKNRVGFVVGPYDPSKPLTIDPEWMVSKP